MVVIIYVVSRLNSQSYIIAKVGKSVLEANMMLQPRSKFISDCGSSYVRRRWSSDRLAACEATNEN